MVTVSREEVALETLRVSTRIPEGLVWRAQGPRTKQLLVSPLATSLSICGGKTCEDWGSTVSRRFVSQVGLAFSTHSAVSWCHQLGPGGPLPQERSSQRRPPVAQDSSLSVSALAGPGEDAGSPSRPWSHCCPGSSL